MTSKEQKTIDLLLESVTELRRENTKFREDVTQQVNVINAKTESKHLPITLETDIMRTTQVALHECMLKVLTSYNSPLHKLVDMVISDNSNKLKEVISDSLNTVIQTSQFKQSIIDAFSHKIARNMISTNDGLLDKVSNELKQDSVFKAKMALAVANVIEECLH